MYTIYRNLGKGEPSVFSSPIYEHFCHSGCSPHISGTATAVVTKLARVQCSDICLPYCYQMQPQRPIASPEGGTGSYSDRRYSDKRYVMPTPQLLQLAYSSVTKMCHYMQRIVR